MAAAVVAEVYPAVAAKEGSMTGEEWDALPLLLKRKHVLRATGWSKDMLDTLIGNGVVHPQKLTGQTQRSFFKEEIQKFIRPAGG